jgi:hypothetical protein
VPNDGLKPADLEEMFDRLCKPLLESMADRNDENLRKALSDSEARRAGEVESVHTRLDVFERLVKDGLSDRIEDVVEGLTSEQTKLIQSLLTEIRERQVDLERNVQEIGSACVRDVPDMSVEHVREVGRGSGSERRRRRRSTRNRYSFDADVDAAATAGYRRRRSSGSMSSRSSKVSAGASRRRPGDNWLAESFFTKLALLVGRQ